MEWGDIKFSPWQGTVLAAKEVYWMSIIANRYNDCFSGQNVFILNLFVVLSMMVKVVLEKGGISDKINLPN